MICSSLNLLRFILSSNRIHRRIGIQNASVFWGHVTRGKDVVRRALTTFVKRREGDGALSVVEVAV